eukprot:3029360-Amphidinium_carterae.1
MTDCRYPGKRTSKHAYLCSFVGCRTVMPCMYQTVPGCVGGGYLTAPLLSCSALGSPNFA